MWDPDRYCEVRDEIPGYEELQEHAAEATAGLDARAVLELGIGTGETTRRVLAYHAQARMTAIDSSPRMVERARESFPGADVRLGKLEDPLPDGPFDLVFSVLAIHHLDGPGKADLFTRIATVVAPGGRLVIGDVVVPDDPADATTPLSPDYDLPSPVPDQLTWLAAAGFEASVVWTAGDLAVLVAER